MKTIGNNKKIRILQFSLAKSMGGRSRYLLDLWKWIDRSKFQMDFVTFCHEKLNIEDKLEEEGCVVYHLPCYPKEDMRLFETAWNHVLDNGYDLVHIGTSHWDGFEIEEITYKRGIKIVVHSHTTTYSRWTSDANRIVGIDLHNRLKENIDIGKIDGFWACSKEAANWLYGQRINENAIFVTYPCIEADRYSFDSTKRDRLRKDILIDKNTYVIGTIGRLVAIKNQEFLIRLFSKYSQIEKNTVLIIVGGGECEEKLRRIAIELGIYNKCRFVGAVDDPVPYYMAMDVFLLTSFHEGFPRVVMEAVASGLDVICSKGIPKEIEKCERVRRIALDEDAFCAELKKKQYVENEERGRGVERIKANGLDITREIKRIEKEYYRVLDKQWEE